MKYNIYYDQTGNALQDDNQIDLDNLIKNMNSNTFLRGSSNIYQWVQQDNDQLGIKSVTIMGESHQAPGTFANCGAANFKLDNSYSIINFFNILFKGTRDCIDFYLESDRLVVKESSDYGSHNEFVSNTIDRTIPQLWRMTKYDIFKASGILTRYHQKRYKNIRMHHTDYRHDTGGIAPYYLFPFTLSNIGNWYGIHNNIAVRIIFRLRGNKRHINTLFSYFQNLFIIISGVINRKTELTDINKRKIRDDIKRVYLKILKFYNRITGNMMGPNPETFLPDVINEQNVLFNYAIKNIKNIQKIDEVTYQVYKKFMNSYLNINNIITLMELHFPEYYRRLYNTNNGIFDFLKVLDLMLMDILCITRSIKVFSVTKQATNLDPSSYCYHQYGLKGRNLLYYCGYAHSTMYHLFWTFYFNRTSDLSVIKSLNLQHVDYNALFSHIYSSIPTDEPVKVTNYRKSNVIDRLVLQYFIYQFSNAISITVNTNYDDKIRKLKIEDSNHFITSANFQCLPNKNNILKKIIVNMSKTEAQIVRYQNLINTLQNYKDTDNVHMLKNQIIQYSQFIINELEIDKADSDFKNMILMSKLNKNGNSILTEPKTNYLVVKDGNFYSKQDYNIRKPTDDFLPPIATLKKMRDKEKLQNKVTDLFSNEILKNYKNRQTLAMFINDVFNKILNKYQKVHPLHALFKPLVKFIYKGGITLRLLGFQYKKQFSIVTENIIDKEYGEFFNISDNDFEIIIKLKETQGINIEEEYNKIYNELSVLSYLILQKITALFNSDAKKVFFDYFSYNKIEQSNMLKNTYDNIKSIIEEEIAKGDLTYEYNNIRDINLLLSNKVGFPPENYDQINNTYMPWNPNNIILENSITNNRVNSIIINEDEDSDTKFIMKDSILFDQIIKNKNILKSIKTSNKGAFYCTFNPKILLGKNNYGFSLSRIKYNFKLFVTKNDSSKKYINLGGEIVDVSIRSFNDPKSKYFTEDDYTKFKYNDKQIKFNYNGYSLLGNINDIILMLFKESKDINNNVHPTDDQTIRYWFTKPWLNIKYEKRLRRLFYLLFLDIMICKDSYYCNDINKGIELLNLIREIINIRSMRELIEKINTILNTIYLYENIHLEQFETNHDISDRKFKEYMYLKKYLSIILFIYNLKEMLEWYSTPDAKTDRVVDDDLNNWDGGKWSEFIDKIDKELIKILHLLGNIKNSSRSELKLEKEISNVSSIGFKN